MIQLCCVHCSSGFFCPKSRASCCIITSFQHFNERQWHAPVLILECLAVKIYFRGHVYPQCEPLFVSVSRTLHKVITGLIGLLPTYIRPPTEAEVQQSKLEFYARGSLQGVFGAVDGTHVRLWEPKPAALAYMNRKGFHSINVMVRLH